MTQETGDGQIQRGDEGCTRWLVHEGVVQGFVPCRNLSSFSGHEFVFKNIIVNTYPLTVDSIGKILPYGIFEVIGAIEPADGHTFQEDAPPGLHRRIFQNCSPVIALCHLRTAMQQKAEHAVDSLGEIICYRR